MSADLPGGSGDFAKGVSGLASVFDTSPAGLGLSPAYLATGSNLTATASASVTGEKFDHNGVLVAAEPILDLVDTSRVVFSVADSAVDTKVTLSADLAQNGAATGAVYRWSGSVWAPTANVIVDDAASTITFATDTTVSRVAAGALGTNGYFQSGTNPPYGFLSTSQGISFFHFPAAAAGNLLVSQVQGEANQRFSLDYAGKLQWGAGGASAVDTNLYRYTSGQLATDGILRVSVATVNEVVVGHNGSAVAAAIYFGNAADTNLYRSVAAMLKTDGGITVSLAVIQKRVTLSYGATVNTDASLGNIFDISVSNTTAWTLANPTNPTDGQVIHYIIRNTSGAGTPGAVTLGAAFKKISTDNLTPVNVGGIKTVGFVYDGTNWLELAPAAQL